MTCFDLRRELQSKEDELEDARAAANKKLKILEQQLEQVTHKNKCFPVLGIRMLLGLPDPDPLVRGTVPDPTPDPSLFS
jgi:hypothetical protein